MRQADDGDYRDVARRVLARYHATEQAIAQRGARPLLSRGKRGYGTSLPEVEYCADVLSIAWRELEPLEREVFRCRFLEGRVCTDCCRRLSLDQGTFFHTVYRIEAKLGRAWAREQLFPATRYYDRRPIAVEDIARSARQARQARRLMTMAAAA